MKEVASESITILKRIIKLVVLLLLVIIACIICKFTIMQSIQNLDEKVIVFFNNLVDPGITSAMKFITYFGSEYIFIPIIICLIFGLRDKRYGMFLAFNLVWTYIMNFILKNIFARPRPVSYLLDDVSGYSFPSSHAMCAVAFYGLLCLFVCNTFKSKAMKRLFIILTSILILAIGFSRIYLQAHYLSDVIMGIVFGVLCLLIFITILKVIDKERSVDAEKLESEVVK